jgi:phosphohistidine phosphatase
VMLAVLRHARGDTVMMIGHNPGIAEFAGRIVAQAPLNTEFARYPTGATTVIDFAVTDWADVAWGAGSTLDFIVPRELAV